MAYTLFAANSIDQADSTHRLWRYLCIILISLIFYVVVIDSAFAREDGRHRNILFINSYHTGYSWSDDILKGFIESVKSSAFDIELSVEYLDTRRFPKPEVLKALSRILLEKYSGYHFDLVVVSDNAAFDFAAEYRHSLFPETPVVFCGYNNFRPEIISGMHNITGVNEEVDVKRLIETALHILPGTKTLAFIISTGDITNKVISEKIEKSIIPAYLGHFKIVVLKDASMARIKAALARLPKASALFLMGQTTDPGQGRELSPIENGRLISSASPVPVFTLWEFHLNTGVLGGRVLSGLFQGRAAGKLALQILNGKKADSIPVLMASPAQLLFDYKVMQRFNLSRQSLPPGSVLINEPRSFFVEHKRIVWTAVSILAMLVAFIIVLSLNILRRIRAEKDLQKHRDHLEMLVKERTAELTDSNRALVDSEEKFRCLSNATFEGIVFTENEIIIEVNDTCCKMFGYDPLEVVGKSAVDFVSPEERAQVDGKMTSGYAQPFITLGLRKDAATFPIEIRGKLLPYKGRDVRVAAIRDLTRQQQAEEEIKTLRGILPICLYCKKIRNDKGYWEQVDIYIRKYSEADVSHGICPECLKKNYPDQYDIIMNRGNTD